MAEPSAFSTSAEDAITRTIKVESQGPSDLSDSEFLEYFEIERTVREITKGGYKRIALQFPDELLHDSVPIYRSLKGRLPSDSGCELYVLADTSYGSCCVDEVAAQHVDANAMVHYGHACMSQTSRLPVIYVFGRKEIDAEDCATQLAACLNTAERQYDTVLLKSDVAYAHASDDIVSRLQSTLPPSVHLVFSPLPLMALPAFQDSTTTSVTSDTPQHLTSPDAILYIGGESLSLTNLLMTHSSAEVYTYDTTSKTTRLESGKTNRLLMRRYAMVQRARDADVFGILVGTLGVASYLPLISHLRTILKQAQKKSYTISVGKLNPAKLANFMEIECFVMVACPENSVVEAKEFLRPIVTPYELEIALQSEPNWTGKYVLDFNEVLSAEKPEGPKEGAEPVDPDEPIFSLVTGRYRHAKRYGGGGGDIDEPPTLQGGSAVALRSQDNALSVLADSASDKDV
ncbi:hypothetical protein EUX98_g1435 [Antrodiella citrinella]|uniref:2-(3-amino-3-carboxypropyl)histidine synthase subunit 2 n=1 Tax=Antrodiella citrinella TaxID=2447956 RepID=A0A4S4N494_9APHY|nr:hypothetical protein EUX98_g1435 [Antrodiella citrinella]